MKKSSTRHGVELRQLTIDGEEVIVQRVLTPSGRGGARKGAGRPKSTTPGKVVSTRVSWWVYAQLEAAAAAMGCSTSHLMAEVLTAICPLQSQEDV